LEKVTNREINVVENMLFRGYFYKDKEGNKMLNGKSYCVEKLLLFRGILYHADMSLFDNALKCSILLSF